MAYESRRLFSCMKRKGNVSVCAIEHILTRRDHGIIKSSFYPITDDLTLRLIPGHETYSNVCFVTSEANWPRQPFLWGRCNAIPSPLF